MNRRLACRVLFAFAIVCWGCGAPKATPVVVPPQVDLHSREAIGVIAFASTSKGELGPLATRRFTEAARRDRLDAAAVIALGLKHNVKTIVTGELAVSSVRPNVRIDTLFRAGSVTAQVDALFEVQIFESESGAALWNRSARATHPVGDARVWGGKGFSFDARNPEAACGGLVDDLVTQVSRPFQASWVRR